MALVKCYECGHQISTEATACPGCGAVRNRLEGELVKAAGGWVLLGIVWFGFILISLLFLLIRAMVTR